jgi:hypothetical protein
MSYEVDSTTLLFKPYMNHEEMQELKDLCRNIVLEGYTDMGHPAYVAWLEAWMKSANVDADQFGRPRQALLTYSIVFPQRALLSMVNMTLADTYSLPREVLAAESPFDLTIRTDLVTNDA